MQDIEEWWLSTNYLTNFVAEYLTDGDVMGWNDFKVPTKVYDIEDTMLVQRIISSCYIHVE